jgi:diaminopimelate decarboxylase
VFKTNFMNQQQAEHLVAAHGSPLFVYAEAVLGAQAQALASVPAPYGYTPRYAMKANPHPKVLEILRVKGINIDASSAYEASKALDLGFKPEQILLTSQQLADNLEELIGEGVEFNATSLHQLESYGQLFPGTAVGVRLNPGIGSGHSVKTNVGGVTSSFGIWHEYIPKIHAVCDRYNLTIKRVHTHIGSGTDPAIWQESTKISLELLKSFPDASIVNLGGGFKVGRLDDELSTDLNVVGEAIAAELRSFAVSTGRELHLELEPGTFVVANAGILISRIIDIVDTGSEGFNFIKLDTGMNDILRPSLYGAQHPISVLNDSADELDYVVVGHNCESGDLLTPAYGQAETLGPRRLGRAKIGDLVLIGGVGAYCASMSAHGYNSYPSAAEIVI